MKSGERGAGVLLHISSLPSKFGCGDMGPQARRFADFLHQSNQRYWQILPLGHTDARAGYSPYSSICSLGINTRLISAEDLASEGLLPKSILRTLTVKSEATVDFQQSCDINKMLLNQAYENFKTKGSLSMRRQFTAFCSAEKNWLDDFAFFQVFKEVFLDTPWTAWPIALRTRDRKAITKMEGLYKDRLAEKKWYQFIGYRQWQKLRDYCRLRNISIIGDMPIYISYDSVDVWTNRKIFSLDSKGNMKEVAGVPPDYFNADGQRWGMPVYRWDILKRQKFKWWKIRIKNNLRLFDVIRLDHFRGFSGYWSIPAGAATAKTGSWKQGPGKNFFASLQKEFKELPFVAEDLGDVDKKVFDLRDAFAFPGMKVLQFAFGDGDGKSSYLPHNFENTNFLVYTGTHDNNTIRGWFSGEITSKQKIALSYFLNERLTRHTIHERMIELAYSSVARIAIVPMADLLGLDGTARMNNPASAAGNWRWRMLPGSIRRALIANLQKLVTTYNRG